MRERMPILSEMSAQLNIFNIIFGFIVNVFLAHTEC